MDSKVCFLKCVTMMAASLAGADMPTLKTLFKTCAADAEEFARSHKCLRVFKKHANAFMKQNLELDDEAAAEFEAEMRPFLPDFNDDVDITKAELGLIKDSFLYMRRDSQPALTRLARNVSVLGDPLINRVYLFKQSDQAEPPADTRTAKEMAKIVERIFGEKGDPILTLNEMRDLAEENPKLAEKYKELRKVFVANYKTSLLHFIRSSGKPVVDVKIVRKYLEAKGCNNIPKGFVGGIDEVGKLYTTEGKQLGGMLIGEVAMNPKYNPRTDDTYVCYLVSNPSQQLRTIDFVAGNRSKRFAVVKHFIEHVEEYRKKWLNDLKSPDDKTAILAAMVETIHQTQARIGGDSTNKEGEDRFGLSTILLSHAKMVNGGFEFEYAGKKGTVQRHVLPPNTVTNKRVIAIIKKCLANKKRTDLVFTYRGKHLDGNTVNRYLRSIGVPNGITAHKFRHLAGTKMAQEIISQAPFSPRDKGFTQASVEKWLKEALIPVGAMLHHRTGSGDKEKVTAMTAIKSYIAPELLHEFFGKLKLRVPDWIPKK